MILNPLAKRYPFSMYFFYYNQLGKSEICSSSETNLNKVLDANIEHAIVDEIWYRALIEWIQKNGCCCCCYFNTPTPFLSLSLSHTHESHATESFVVFFIHHQMLQSLILFYTIWWHYIYIYHFICSSFISKERCLSGLAWTASHRRWTMFIGKPRVLTSNTHAHTKTLVVEKCWGREAEGKASKLSKIKSTVRQVLNPVVLTTFCFSLYYFLLRCCFDGRQQWRQQWYCWLLFVVDAIAISVLPTVTHTYTCTLALSRQVQNHLWRSLDRWCVMMCVTELPLCRIWIFFTQAMLERKNKRI